MLRHDVVVLTAASQNAAMDFRVQGFNAAVHHFRKARVIGDFRYRQASFRQQTSRAARGEELNPTR